MDLVLIRLSRGGQHAGNGNLPSPEVVADIMWANATSGDRLEHIRARHGPEPGSFDLALFLVPGTTQTAPGTAQTAMNLCRRAIAAAPPLTGWTADPIGDNALHDRTGAPYVNG